MKKTAFAVILLSLMLQLAAYSLYEQATGNNVPGTDARSAAMGGAGVAGGTRPLDANLNPANLALLTGRLQVQGNFMLTRMQNDRSVPMYNFFDSYLDDAVYATNAEFYTDFTAQAAYMLDLGKNRFAFGLGIAPVYDYRFDYDEEVRNNENSEDDNFPKILADNYYKGEGALWAYSLSAAWSQQLNTPIMGRYLTYVSAGVMVSMLNGNSETNKDIYWSDWANEQVNAISYDALPDSHERTKTTTEGYRFNLGTNIGITPNLTVAAAFTPKTTLDVTDEIEDIDSETDLPAELAIGFNWKPRNIMETEFRFDWRRRMWEDVSSMLYNQDVFSVGVEHKIIHRLPLRLGLNWCNSPLNDEITWPTFTAGTGFEIYPNVNADISFAFSNRSYTDPDLFPDSYYNDTQYTHAADSELWVYPFTPQDRQDEDKVEETMVRSMFTITYSW